MKAQVIHEFGDPSVFTLIDLPIPDVKPGHILVKVAATSVNPIDCKVRSGAVPTIAPPFPAVLHGDVCGIVEIVGKGVTRFRKGDEVYGCAGGFFGLHGALAEFMLVDEKLMAKKPKSLSMQDTAALPLVSITAWIALFEKIKLAQDRDLLIHAGGGGVGHIAVQLAQWCGATVYATVRKNEDFFLLKSWGVDHIINVQEESVATYKKRLTHNQGFNAIFDTVGGTNLNHSFEAAALNGTIVTIAARSTHDLTPMHIKGLSLHCVSMLSPLLTNQNREHYGGILEKFAHLVDDGKLKPRLDPHHYTLERVAQAHAHLESGKAQGKIVISVIE